MVTLTAPEREYELPGLLGPRWSWHQENVSVLMGGEEDLSLGRSVLARSHLFPHFASHLPPSRQEAAPLWSLCAGVLHVLWPPEKLSMKHLSFQLC